MNPRPPAWATLIPCLATLLLWGCIAADRPLAGGLDATTVADGSDDTARDATDAPDDGAAPDAADTRDGAAPDDTAVADTRDTAVPDGDCVVATDCAGGLAPCEAWTCDAGHRCVAAPLPHAEAYKGKWFFTSTTIADGATRTSRGHVTLDKNGTWRVERDKILQASDGAELDGMAGSWCVGADGAAELHGADAGELRHLYGQLADGGEILVLGARDLAQLVVLMPAKKGFPRNWADDGRYRVIGLDGSGGTALRGYVGPLELRDDEPRCRATLTTSDGAELTLTSTAKCLDAHDDGKVEMAVRLGDEDGGEEAVDTHWYGHFAAKGGFIVLTRTQGASADDTPPFPGVMMLVREADDAALRLGGTYVTYRVGLAAGGVAEGVWGSAHDTLTGDVDALEEHAVGGGTVRYEVPGCGTAGRAECPGWYVMSDAEDLGAGAVVETLVGGAARVRGGQALSIGILGRAAALWVSYARGVSPAPTRPSLGVHVRRLDLPGGP
ncbi:MAG: hypothetical protein KC635_01765 [Myxococcales bacterium]|nr:hypothetical protein [Myxococcales bacterium]